MYLILRVVVFVILTGVIFPATGFARSFTDRIDADFDGDGRVERIEVDAGRDQALEIKQNGSSVWRGIPKAWHPWKLAIGDVDGDGKQEIALGVFKPTKFFTTPHNCLFLYNWNGKSLEPKWLGSSLSRPFVDFAFAELAGAPGDELIAIEKKPGGQKTLAVYRWNGFGFTLERQKGSWNSAGILGIENKKVKIRADNETILINMDL